MTFPNHINTINAYFKAGLSGATWYNETREQVAFIFGDDTDLFCDFLAATSPNTTVKANVTLALKAYKQYKSYEDFTGFMGIIIKMLRTAVINDSTIGHKFKMGGSKVHNFARALKGDLDAVVVDRWMLRAFGYDKDIITDKRYRDIEAWCVAKAEREGMKPAEVQAAIWCGIKSKDERFTDTSKIDDFLPFELAA